MKNLQMNLLTQHMHAPFLSKQVLVLMGNTFFIREQKFSQRVGSINKDIKLLPVPFNALTVTLMMLLLFKGKSYLQTEKLHPHSNTFLRGTWGPYGTKSHTFFLYLFSQIFKPDLGPCLSFHLNLIDSLNSSVYMEALPLISLCFSYP